VEKFQDTIFLQVLQLPVRLFKKRRKIKKFRVFIDNLNLFGFDYISQSCRPSIYALIPCNST